MRTTRPLAATLLVTAATLVAAVGCTHGATPGPTASRTAASTSPAGATTRTPLLPVWHHTQSARLDEPWMLGLDRIGFVDTSGRLVVEPRYAKFRTCPDAAGKVLVVAQAGHQVDVLDADGNIVASAAGELAECGPLPGFVQVVHRNGDLWDWWAATLPDLSRSDLPTDGAFAVLDADTMLFSVWEGDDHTTELVSRSGERVVLAVSIGNGYFYGGEQAALSSGEWPVPATDSQWSYGYLDQSGRWAAPPQWSSAGPFSGGYAPVRDKTRSHFVNTSFAQVGPAYGNIEVLVAPSFPSATVLGYVVTPVGEEPGGKASGLLAADLTVLADPATSTTECRSSWDLGHGACLVVDEAGTWLVSLPDGTRSAVDKQFTALLSRTMVTNADGTKVHNSATGATFAVPAPFHVVGEWGSPGDDAFVVCESGNGLRLVLDASGQRTPFSTVTNAVVASDGTVYFWVHAGDQQGYVDSTGAWLYQESRYQLTED
ncbi:MAG: WG repeat-containing protein [Micrococcales bacterium]|nr:WG repeat-containing protein [Micrococcales bacterium]MCL2667156.1 WG repeat-containing protein [Micrococcales bacterium]